MTFGVDRAAAERVFDLIADLRGDLRDRLVHERWWLVWIVMGLQIPISNAITQILISRGERRAGVHIIVWGVQVALVPLTIRLIHRRSGGRRSQRETFIWWIWTSFLLAACFVALLNTLLRLPIFFTAPIIPLLAAFGFSMMAMAVHRVFLLAAVFFVACVILMTLLPSVQFYIYGAAWFIVLEALGLYFRPRRVSESRAL
jgi:hypothetical protein